MGANAHCASRRKAKGKARSSCSIPEQKPGGPQRHGRQNGLWAKKMMSPFPTLWNLCSATSAATQERWNSGENLKPQIRSQARWNFLRLRENDRRNAAPSKRSEERRVGKESR